MSVKSDDIIFLVGAGASAEAGIPTSGEMIDKLELKIIDKWGKFKNLYNLIKAGFKYSCILTSEKNFNVEILMTVLEEMEKKEEHPLYPYIGSWNIKFNETISNDFNIISEFRSNILKEVKNWVKLSDNKSAIYYSHLGRIRKEEINFPLRIFSLNYDLCIEKTQDNSDFQYKIERGFEIESNKQWNYKRFEEMGIEEQADIILYKLHGSLDWETREPNIFYCVDSIPDKPSLIFGTQYKLQYGDPYLYLFSQLRYYSLSCKLIICIGYSFSDEHVNTILSQALQNDKDRKIYSVAKNLNDDDIAKKLGIDVNKQIIAENDLTAKDFLTNFSINQFNDYIKSDVYIF